MHVSTLIKQKPYERVVYVLRRHWFTFLPKILIFVILSVIPPILYLMITTLFPAVLLNDILVALGILFGSLYYLSILLFFYTEFIIFYLDMWVVTNDRIMDIEQLGLFSRTISELDLFRIQDVTTDVHGFFATLFDYGDVSVKTASSNVHIVFYKVPHPNTIRENLIRLSHEDRKFHLSKTIEDEN